MVPFGTMGISASHQNHPYFGSAHPLLGACVPQFEKLKFSASTEFLASTADGHAVRQAFSGLISTGWLGQCPGSLKPEFELS